MKAHIKETMENIDNIIDNQKRTNYNLKKEDDYQMLMNKENKVLNLLDDIHKEKQKQRSKYDYLWSAPVHVVIYKTFQKLTTILQELSEVSDIYDLLDVVTSQENVLYVGILFVFLAIILMFVNL